MYISSKQVYHVSSKFFKSRINIFPFKNRALVCVLETLVSWLVIMALWYMLLLEKRKEGEGGMFNCMGFKELISVSSSVHVMEESS